MVVEFLDATLPRRDIYVPNLTTGQRYAHTLERVPHIAKARRLLGISDGPVSTATPPPPATTTHLIHLFPLAAANISFWEHEHAKKALRVAFKFPPWLAVIIIDNARYHNFDTRQNAF